MSRQFFFVTMPNGLNSFENLNQRNIEINYLIVSNLESGRTQIFFFLKKYIKTKQNQLNKFAWPIYFYNRRQKSFR